MTWNLTQTLIPGNSEPISCQNLDPHPAQEPHLTRVHDSEDSKPEWFHDKNLDLNPDTDPNINPVLNQVDIEPDWIPNHNTDVEPDPISNKIQTSNETKPQH